MKIPEFSEDLDVIQKLSTFPNAEDGLTAEELKRKFDEAPNKIKDWLNEVLIPAMDEAQVLALEVTVSGNAADGFASDLEFDEIRQAHDAGQACVCLWGSWRLPLVSIADEVARFAAVVDGICYQAEVSQDGVTAGDAVLDNRTRIVTMQGSEEKGYTTDFTLSAILAAHNQGPVVCLCDGIYLPLVAVDGSRAVFSGHDYGTGKYTMVNFHSAGFQVTHGNIGSTGDSGDVSEDVFYIEFDGTEGDYGLGTSRAEIVAAYESGQELRCLVPVGTGVADIPLVHKTVDENGVELRFGGSSAYLKESEGGRTVSAFIGIRDGGVEWGALLHPVVRDGKYIVNITSDGRGGYKADKSYNGVLAVHNAKVLPIECRITVDDISYVVPLCGLFDGRLIYGGSAGGLSLAVFHESNESVTVMADTLVTNMTLEERLEPINTALGTYIQDVDTLIGGDG